MTEKTDAQIRRWHCFWGHLARAERMVLAQLNRDDPGNEDDYIDTWNELSFEADFDDCEDCWDSIANYLADQLAYYRSAALAAGVPPYGDSPWPEGIDPDAAYEAAIAETCDRISVYLEYADPKNPPPPPSPAPTS